MFWNQHVNCISNASVLCQDNSFAKPHNDTFAQTKKKTDLNSKHKHPFPLINLAVSNSFILLVDGGRGLFSPMRSPYLQLVFH